MRLLYAAILLLISATGFISWLIVNQSQNIGAMAFIGSGLACLVCLALLLYSLRTFADRLDRWHP